MSDGSQGIEGSVLDLRATERVSPAQMRVLEGLHADFCARITSSLSTYLNTTVTATSGTLSQTTFEQHLAENAETAGCVATITAGEASALIVLELGNSIAAPFLELLLGGSVKSAASISRDFTDVEQSLLEAVIRVLIGNLRESWRNLSGQDINLDVRWLGSMTSAKDLMAPDEPVVAAPVDIALEEDIGGAVCIVLPCLLLRELRTRFEPPPIKEAPSGEQRSRLSGLLSAIPLMLEPRLQGTHLPLADVLKLTEGALLVLDWPLDRPIDGLINNVPKFRGHLAASGKKRGFVVEGVL